MTSSAGYTFYFDANNNLRAGCRSFATKEEARAHWASDDYDGLISKAEAKAILAYMESIWPND